METLGVIQWVLSIAAVIFAVISSMATSSYKKSAKIAGTKALMEQQRAEVAEEATKLIIKSEKVANEKVKEARIIAETIRGRFTDNKLK